MVNQQLEELKMKKLNLFVVRPTDTKEDVYKKLIDYLKQQGIKIVKEDNNEKKKRLINILILIGKKTVSLHSILQFQDQLEQKYIILKEVLSKQKL